MKTIKTPRDFARVLEDAAEREKVSRETDDRFTTRFWVSKKLMFEAIVVGHLRALDDAYHIEDLGYWASHVSNCFERDVTVGMHNMLDLLPLVERWLRSCFDPDYKLMTAELGIDIGAAIQNIGTYLRENGAIRAAHEHDLKTFRKLIDLPTRRT